MIVKACSRNITGSTNLPYNEKVDVQVPVSLFFQVLPCTLAKKSGQNARCFIHRPYMFATQFNYITAAY